MQTYNDEAAAALSGATGFSPRFCGLLIDRGADTPEKVNAFLKPSVSGLSDPYRIAGMDAAAARLFRALKNREKTVIYGDYDCDGICSISMLMLCFGKELPDLEFFIPDRNLDGYGMSMRLLQSIVEKSKPSLIITVDTGITAVDEAVYLKSLGIDLIVTDHHEPQGVLPDAIIVNPKVEKKGFYEFCGAGVAFKLIEAVKGREKALEYADLAALATIADIVPLNGENRIIAALGLKSINKKPRLGIELLINNGESNKGGARKTDAGDIAFKLAPRLNAAGRIDHAAKAVELFLSEDYFLLKCLAGELCADNRERQERCETIIADAKALLAAAGVADRAIIMLSSPLWDAGILGIAAARLTEEFDRPTILFSESDGFLKGSARSVKAVNIFELLKRFSRLFEKFGGHAQAAGLSLKAENLPLFEAEAEKYLHSVIGARDAETVCDAELTVNGADIGFAKELELLEPTGYGNRKPRFFLRTDGLRFQPIGTTKHLKYREKDFELVGFNRSDEALALSGKCVIEFSLGVNVFGNVESAQGIIRAVTPEPTGEDYDLTNAYIKALSLTEEKENISQADVKTAGNKNGTRAGTQDGTRAKEDRKDGGEPVSGASTREDRKDGEKTVLHETSRPAKAVYTDNIYSEAEKYSRTGEGNLYVAFSNVTYRTFLASRAEAVEALSVAVSASLNPINRLALVPPHDFPWGYYEKIFFLEAPPSEAYLNAVLRSARRDVTVSTDKKYLDVADIPSDAELREFYTRLRAHDGKRAEKEGFSKLFAGAAPGWSVFKTEASAAVLAELKLIDLSGGMLKVFSNKTALENSALYVNLRALHK